MPRVEHESWCESPEAKDDGFCSSEYVYFGPVEDALPEPVGGLFAIQREGGRVEVGVDFRFNDGVMSFGALRTVREAVANEPDAFLAGLDRIIETLGDAVPHVVQPDAGVTA